MRKAVSLLARYIAADIVSPDVRRQIGSVVFTYKTVDAVVVIFFDNYAVFGYGLNVSGLVIGI